MVYNRFAVKPISPHSAMRRRSTPSLAETLRRRPDRQRSTHHQSPFTFHLSPITFHQSPFTNHLSPITFHQSPLTNHLSPITFHQSPLTNHLSPITSHLPLSPHIPLASKTYEIRSINAHLRQSVYACTGGPTFIEWPLSFSHQQRWGWIQPLE
jgi:hypothetical protein